MRAADAALAVRRAVFAGALVHLQSQGLAYTERRHAVPNGKAVEIQGPDRSLGLVFVTAEACAAGRRDGQ